MGTKNELQNRPIKNSSPINHLLQFTLFIIMYWFFGALFLILLFGFEDAVNILFASPFSNTPGSGVLILFSSLLSSILLFIRMKKKLLFLPYPYFMLGFYVGNVTFLIMFLIDGFITEHNIWEFPKFLFMFLAPFAQLLVLYIFGFVFLSLLPAWFSAYIIYKLRNYLKAS